jgi:hypothetical protein
MSFPEIRKFLLASYHDLPNILFVGSLILGALMGYLPLIWMALGLILNAAVVSFLQAILNVLFTADSSRARLFGDSKQLSTACSVGFKNMRGGPMFGNVPDISEAYSPGRVTTPSHWIAAATFFAVFSIYNSARLMAREPAKGADGEKVGARRAFSLSALIVGFFFLALVLARAFTGCETLWSGFAGFAVGSGLSIAFWHILDACGTGKIPDLLQVVGSLAPEAIGSGDAEVPVVCTAPPPQD